MKIIPLDTLSAEQQSVYERIPEDYLDILHEMTWEEHLKFIGVNTRTFYVNDIFNPRPRLFDPELLKKAEFYTYDNIIFVIDFPKKRRFQLGIPYTKKQWQEYTYMDSHDHSLVTREEEFTYYSVLCYSLTHPRFQELLSRKEEEQKKADAEALIATHKEAENGSVKACIRLSYYYDLEWSRNNHDGAFIQKAVYWARKAAEQNDAEALRRLVDILSVTLSFCTYPWKEDEVKACYELVKINGDEELMKKVREIS